MTKAFSTNLNDCTGCQACVLACSIENQLPIDQSWRSVSTFNATQAPELPVYHLSIACNHCAEPACEKYCPALAYSLDPLTGAVLLDPDLCIGCKYCSWVCPYDAPRFDQAAGVMRKCTFCNERLHAGREPACVAYCPTSALGVTDTADEPLPGGTIDIPGFPRSELKPSIAFQPLRPRGDRPLASIAADAGRPEPIATAEAIAPKASIRSEWTLLAFTLSVAALFSWLGAAVFRSSLPRPVLFLAIGAAAMGVSTMHLGRPLRAWRAILNWRRSWVSREILTVSAMIGLAAGAFVLEAVGESTAALWAGRLAWIAGLAALFSMDSVYHVAATVRSTRGHSASVLLTGLFGMGLLLQIPLFAGPLAALKAGLYLRRKRMDLRDGRPVRPLLAAIRVLPGLVLPIVLLAWTAPPLAVVLAAAALGELIDRAEFYDELDIITPRHEVARA